MKPRPCLMCGDDLRESIRMRHQHAALLAFFESTRRCAGPAGIFMACSRESVTLYQDVLDAMAQLVADPQDGA